MISQCFERHDPSLRVQSYKISFLVTICDRRVFLDWTQILCFDYRKLFHFLLIRCGVDNFYFIASVVSNVTLMTPFRLCFITQIFQRL